MLSVQNLMKITKQNTHTCNVSCKGHRKREILFPFPPNIFGMETIKLAKTRWKIHGHES